MINPYANINWNTVEKVMSISHEHCENQTEFGYIVNGGAKHIAISNYYPSKPVYPLSDMFTDIPSDVIASPNAEHHNFNVTDLHMNSLGSFFQSGSPRGETPFGVNLASPKTIVPQIIAQLQYPDGGGVTINHPTWSNLTVETIESILDIDDRVLGLEIFNSFIGPVDIGWEGATAPHIESMESNIEKWDEVLKTGRRCWGFCVADHQGQANSNWMGRNMLLVPSKTEYNCLKAYRKGEFYGQLKRTDLTFTGIGFTNNVLSVSTNNAETIDIVVDGVKTSYSASSATQSIPSGATYVRAEAHTSEDSIFSNPIMINPKNYICSSTTNKILLGLL